MDPKFWFKPNVKRLKTKKNVKALINALKYTKDLNVQKEAANALIEIGDKKAIEPIIQVIKSLKDEDGYVRGYIIEALYKLHDESVFNFLISALNNDDYIIRRQAIDFIRILGDERAIHYLILALMDEDSMVRKQAARTLGEIGDKRAVEPLVQIGYDEISDVEFEVATALLKLGDNRAIESFIHILRCEYHIREKAEQILLNIGHPAIGSLVSALKDQHYGISKGSSEILNKLGWESNSNIEKAWYMIARGELQEVVKLGKIAVEPLIYSLKYWRVGQLREYVRILGEIGDKRAVEPLIQVLKSVNYIDDIIPILDALGKLGDESAVAPLIQTLSSVNNEIRLKAAMNLGKMGYLQAAEPIINWIFNNIWLNRWDDPDHRNQLRPYLCNLFRGYTELILNATSSLDYQCKHHMKGKLPSGINLEIDDAIHKLCKVPTQISTNILYKLSQQKDIEVVVDHSCDIPYYATLSFEFNRRIATEELNRRGNPSYDPSIYLDKEAWKL